MKTRIGTFVLLMFVLSLSCAWSQTDTTATATGTDDTQTTPGPKPAFTYPDRVSPLTFLSGAGENSNLRLGVGGGVFYDSNAGSFGATQGVSRILYQFRPSIGIRQFRPKIVWNLNYQGGLQSYSYVGSSASYNSAYSNIFSSIANADILWQMSPRWQLHLNDVYVYTANPFDSFSTVQIGPPTTNDPNPVAYYALARTNSNQGLMGLTYQLGAHDTLDFSGTENFRRTHAYGTLQSPFYNLVSYGGRGAYSHQVSARLSLGGSYNYNSLDFGHGVQRSGIQTVQGNVEYKIQRNMSISLWAGPEYTSIKDVVQFFFFRRVIHQSLWSPAVGASFGWQGLRNALRASFSRQVSDGGALLGTTQLYQVNAELRRQLSSKWSAYVGGTFYDNISVTLTSRKFSTTAFNAGVTRNLTPSLTATAQYAFVRQIQKNIYQGLPKYDDNRIGLTVQYFWNHPLGW